MSPASPPAYPASPPTADTGQRVPPGLPAPRARRRRGASKPTKAFLAGAAVSASLVMVGTMAAAQRDEVAAVGQIQAVGQPVSPPTTPSGDDLATVTASRNPGRRVEAPASATTVPAPARSQGS